ncbi:MAG: galactose mutarotase [Maritimibacter sp.]|nr:galactose mutarotase [Maritimibacter sp.]
MITRGITRIGGQAVDAAHLTAGDMEVALLSYGAITQSWFIGGRNIVLGYDDPADYATDKYYHGAIAGRVANRIANGRFPLAGGIVELPVNEGPNTLHGGPEGISKKHWTMEPDTSAGAVRLAYTSPDGESGFPGQAAFEMIVTLTDTTLTYDMRAEVDRPTPINLVQHNYYNLAGGGRVDDHVLSVPARAYIVAGDDLIVTGARADVAGTRYDFREARTLGAADPEGQGLDACLVLDSGAPGAVLSVPGGPTLSFFTGQPGIQVYNANTLGAPFAPFTAVCLEPEGFPGAVNQPDFPSQIVTPEAPYRQKLTIEVA